MTDIQDLRCFVAVYQSASFTAAAARLKVSKVAVAKRIAALEAKQGARLFRRSTRRLSPTPEADELYGRALALLQHVHDFEVQLEGRSPMRGSVRVTCSHVVATTFVGELLVQFQRQHPGLEVELVATDSVLDLVEHGVDLAIRVGSVRQGSLVGRKLGDNALVLCAAPSYLAAAPPLKRLADVKHHPVFCMTYHLGARFAKSGRQVKDVIGPQRFTTNEGALVAKLGAAGHGLVVRSRWSIKDELEAGALVPVLPLHPLEPLGSIWLVSTAGRLQSARIRAVFEMLVERSKPYLSG